MISAFNSAEFNVMGLKRSDLPDTTIASLGPHVKNILMLEVTSCIKRKHVNVYFLDLNKSISHILYQR